MNQPLLTFPSLDLFLPAQQPLAQRLSFSEKNRPVRGAFCVVEINRWIARWENEGGAVALGRSVDYVTS